MKRLIKWSSWMVALLFCCGIANATVLSGTFRYPDGSAITGQLLVSLPKNGVYNVCASSAYIIPTTTVIIKIVNGAIQGSTDIVPSDCMSTWQAYKVQLLNQNNVQVFQGYWYITQPGGAAVSPSSGNSYLAPVGLAQALWTRANQIRGSGIQSALTGTSINVPWPSGTQAGDLAEVFGTTAYDATLPSGWTPDEQVTGSVWNILVMHKVLNSTDISTGHVTVSIANNFDNIFAITTFKGDPGPIREAATPPYVEPNDLNPTTVTTDTAVTNTDLALFFGSARNGGTTRTVTTTIGSNLQPVQDDGSSAFALLSSVTPSTGALTQNWTYGDGSTPFFTTQNVIVIVENAGGPTVSNPIAFVVPSNLSGFRVNTISTGSVPGNGSVSMVVSWPSEFPSTSYTATCSVIDTASPSSPSLYAVGISNVAVDSVTVSIGNTNGSAKTGTISCRAHT